MNWFYDLLDTINNLVENNIWLAPFIGVLLPLIEAIIPSLPLTVIVAFSLSLLSSLFGVVEGTILTIILSTIGSFLGMFIIFIIIRVTLGKYFAKKINESKYGKVFLNAVNGRSMWLVLALLSNPFLPSSILNYALSFTKIKIHKYLFLSIVSRLIVITFLVFLGAIFDIQNRPLNVLWMMLVYFVILTLWIFYLRSRKKHDKSIFKNYEE